jgi:hypothetical protein
MTVDKSSPVRKALGKTSRVQRIVSESDNDKALYNRLFSTRDGKAVLKDLQKRFYDNPMDGADLNREAGRRDVLHFIKRYMTP